LCGDRIATLYYCAAAAWYHGCCHTIPHCETPPLTGCEVRVQPAYLKLSSIRCCCCCCCCCRRSGAAAGSLRLGGMGRQACRHEAYRFRTACVASDYSGGAVLNELVGGWRWRLDICGLSIYHGVVMLRITTHAPTRCILRGVRPGAGAVAPPCGNNSARQKAQRFHPASLIIIMLPIKP
jgi:hypothetical protein